MTHLYIEQNTGLTEEVNSSIISKLYELAISGDLDNTSDLKGRLHSISGYADEVSYLNTNFSDLYITLDKSYIKFADATILNRLKHYIGDGTGVTTQDAQNIQVFGAPRNTSSFGTQNWFTQYTEKIPLTTFDEFELFINVTELYGKTFESWINLQSIKLPPNITTIGTQCFDKCYKITSLVGLSNITTIPDYAFRDCSRLETIDIDFSQITKIGSGAFSGCGVLSALNTNDINEDEYTLPASSIGDSAFQNTDLTGKTIIMPNITNISSNLFKNTKISKFVGTNVTSVGSQAFYNCTQLQEVDLGNVTTIDNYHNGVFQKCGNLTTIKFGNLTNDFTNLQYIGRSAFYECGIQFPTNLSLPNATYIGLDAFRGHTEIQSITNLGSITSLNDSQFWDCSNISSVTLPNTLTSFSLTSLGKTALTYVQVPEGVTDAGFGQCVFSSGLFRYAEFPSTVTTMTQGFHRSFEGSGNSGLNTVMCVIKATTPPTVTYYQNQVEASLNGVRKLRGIYVPDSALSTYQSASGFWSYSDVQAILKPISQLETDSPTYWAIYQQGLSN